MGKVGRHKRFKSVDPFSKHNTSQHGNVVRTKEKGRKKPKQNELYDLPPKDDNFNQMKEHQKLPHIDEQLKKKRKKKRTLPQKHKMLPGETKKQYLNRLDSDIGVAIQNALMDTKKMRPKRKEYLQNRDKKKKQQKDEKQGLHGNKEPSIADQPKFGEVVEEPPQLPLPRKGEKKNKTTGLKLAHLLEKEDASLSSPAKKRRKDMSELQKQHFDAERESAIQRYRQLKKRATTSSQPLMDTKQS